MSFYFDLGARAPSGANVAPRLPGSHQPCRLFSGKFAWESLRTVLGSRFPPEREGVHTRILLTSIVLLVAVISFTDNVILYVLVSAFDVKVEREDNDNFACAKQSRANKASSWTTATKD